MARPVAGIRNKTIIVTLPGSPKGAKENLLGILKLLPHACMQAAGADSRALHKGGVKKLEEEAGLSATKDSHHYHHEHSHPRGHNVPRAHTPRENRPESNDPRDGPPRRYRSSPYPMIAVEEAIQIILKESPPLLTHEAIVDNQLIGYVLARDVQAKEAVPAYRASRVDGYALIVPEDGPSPKGILHVASVSHARPGKIPALQPGQISRITTGAPLPPGATSVAMVEDTVLRSLTDDETEEKEVEILTDEIKPNENVREIGSDTAMGEVILRKGDKVTAIGGELGLLASVGQKLATVYRKPIVGILSTGDEIVNHNRQGALRLGEVRDCNRPTIQAVVQGWGFEVIDLGIANDT